MDERNFSERLKAIKAEVLALKQAHEYGLGRADFPWTAQEIHIDDNTSGTITVNVIFNDTVENMPYLQIYTKLRSFNWFGNVSGTWANHTFTIVREFEDWWETNDTFYVVATMPFKDVEVIVDYV